MVLRPPDEIDSETRMKELQTGFEQASKLTMQAANKLGIDLS